jgi:hypothetical protein
LLHLFSENGKFRAYQGTEFTIYTRLFPSFFHFRDVVPLGIYGFGFLKNLLWAELDTYVASLTTFGDDIDLAFGNFYLV